MEKIIEVRHPYLDRYVNTYVLNTGSHSLLFDTGMFHGHGRLEAASTGKPVVISTHGDWDHIGGHGYFHEKGVRVYAHPNEAKRLKEFEWHWNAYFEQFRQDCYFPPERQELFWNEIGTPLTADESLEDGQILCFDDCKIQVIHTPGHTSGSCCFYIPEEGILITGDTLMGMGFFGGMPQYSQPKAYAASMERLQKLDVERVYLCHRDSIPGRELKVVTEQGWECALRFEKTLRSILESYEDRADVGLKEIADRLAASEGKSSGNGVCVDVLGYFDYLQQEYPLAKAIRAKYDLCP